MKKNTFREVLCCCCCCCCSCCCCCCCWSCDQAVGDWDWDHVSMMKLLGQLTRWVPSVESFSEVCLIYVAFGLLLNIRMIHKAVLNGQVWHCTFGVSCRFYSWVHEGPPRSSILWSGLLVLPKDNILLEWMNLVSHLVRRDTHKSAKSSL